MSKITAKGLAEGLSNLAFLLRRQSAMPLSQDEMLAALALALYSLPTNIDRWEDDDEVEYECEDIDFMDSLPEEATDFIDSLAAIGAIDWQEDDGDDPDESRSIGVVRFDYGDLVAFGLEEIPEGLTTYDTCFGFLMQCAAMTENEENLPKVIQANFMTLVMNELAPSFDE